MSPPDESSSDDVGNRESGPNGSGPVAWFRWFRTTDDGTVVFVREMLESAAIVVAIGLLLFAVSGVWPPMVAVESGSMEPHMEKGDLVFIMDEHRFPPGAAHGDTGVATYRASERAGYKSFNDYGDVIIYRPNGNAQATPIIHRTRFWVEDGENWYDRADPRYLGGAENCEELANCPAPHAGFITKGDDNEEYDQAFRLSGPVKPSWVRGTAEVKIPWLGHVRLLFSEADVRTGTHYEPHSPAGPYGPQSIGGPYPPQEPANQTTGPAATA